MMCGGDKYREHVDSAKSNLCRRPLGMHALS